MSNKEIAAQLKILSSQVKDQVLWLLKAYGLLKEANIAEVVNAYQEITAGKLKVAEVRSAVTLTQEQQATIKNAVAAKFANEQLVFVFNLDPETENAIQIKVDDNSLELAPKLTL